MFDQNNNSVSVLLGITQLSTSVAVVTMAVRAETRGNADITSLTGLTSEHGIMEPLFKIKISLKLKIFGNFKDIVSTQLQEIYHTVQVIFGYFITKFLHIGPLIYKDMYLNTPCGATWTHRQ